MLVTSSGIEHQKGFRETANVSTGCNRIERYRHAKNMGTRQLLVRLRQAKTADVVFR